MARMESSSCAKNWLFFLVSRVGELDKGGEQIFSAESGIDGDEPLKAANE